MAGNTSMQHQAYLHAGISDGETGNMPQRGFSFHNTGFL